MPKFKCRGDPGQLQQQSAAGNDPKSLAEFVPVLIAARADEQ